MPAEAADRTVAVTARGRLHLGFLDPAATLGRRFGSLGLVVDGFACEVRLGAAGAAALADEVVCDAGPDAAADAARAAAWLARLHDASGLVQPLRLHLGRRLPAHAGLGSGTQLALAIGRAFAAWHGLEVDTLTLARWLGRGLRSGVGIAGFDAGGLLLDGGPGADGRPAPLLSRIAFPPAWRIVVALDPRTRGLSGAEERAAIAALPPLPRPQAAELCHEALMRVLPGAADGDFALFAAGLNRVQQLLGEHFAPAQPGGAFTSPAVARAIAPLAGRDGAAVGQSSWGPTGFAVLPSAAAAEAVLARLRAAQADGAIDPALDLRVVAGCNRGADVAG